jgi:hypothetical protein
MDCDFNSKGETTLGELLENLQDKDYRYPQPILNFFMNILKKNESNTKDSVAGKLKAADIVCF